MYNRANVHIDNLMTAVSQLTCMDDHQPTVADFFAGRGIIGLGARIVVTYYEIM